MSVMLAEKWQDCVTEHLSFRAFLNIETLTSKHLSNVGGHSKMGLLPSTLFSWTPPEGGIAWVFLTGPGKIHDRELSRACQNL